MMYENLKEIKKIRKYKKVRKLQKLLHVVIKTWIKYKVLNYAFFFIRWSCFPSFYKTVLKQISSRKSINIQFCLLFSNSLTEKFSFLFLYKLVTCFLSCNLSLRNLVQIVKFLKSRVILIFPKPNQNTHV